MPTGRKYQFWTSDEPRRTVDDGQVDELVEVDWKELIERLGILVRDHRVVVILCDAFDLLSENHKKVKKKKNPENLRTSVALYIAMNQTT